ncbi:helix-turn-helix domain-containing protein [Streptomyces anandii]|uniref:helix-turn-helix domain-containing protein n=1 Tax=Streptomyces anandii TaxID=285454 RepID=UPI00369C4C2B
MFEKGLSQAELGEPLFVSGSFIGQLEAGTRRMHVELAAQLDEVLGTNGFFTRSCAALAKSRWRRRWPPGSGSTHSS